MGAFGGPDQAGAVVAVLGVDVRSGAQGEVEQPRVVADLAGGDQVGALPGVVLQVDVGAGLHEQGGGVDLVAVGGADQRGRALVVPGVDGRALIQQRPHGSGVAAPRGLTQRRGRIGPARRGRRRSTGGGEHHEQAPRGRPGHRSLKIPPA